jgi:hypothetical protein
MRVPADDEEIVLRLISPFEAWPKREGLPERLTFQTPLSLERWPPYDRSRVPQPIQGQSVDEIPSPSRPRRSQDSASLPTEQPPSPNQRLARMRGSFEADKSVLADDYAYFTTPHASIHPNKVEHTSAEQSERQSLEQSETQSSDKSDD